MERRGEPTEPRDGPSAGLWGRLKQWLGAHHLTLMTLPDTPHAIALGSAIGVFFGFTPLFGLKTLLSLALAWALKANKIAAFISVTLHDLILPFWPAIVLWEYKMGMWAMQRRVPARLGFRHGMFVDLMEWTTFFTVGQPLLIGSLFLALPAALLVYFALRGVLIRSHARKGGEEGAAGNASE